MRIFKDRPGTAVGCIFGMLALSVILASFGLSDPDVPGDACIAEACHETVYQEGASNPFIHSPFIEKQCDRCHVPSVSTAGAVLESVPKSLAQPVVVSEPDYQAEHLVLLRGLEPRASYDVSVSLADSSGNIVSRAFPGVVPAEVQDVRTDDNRPPQILDVRVGPVTRQVFLETTVTWKTDEPATSWVEYGFSDGYDQHSAEDPALVKNHEVDLHELAEGKSYHLRVVSQDPFGNEAVSGAVAFDTLTVLPAEGSGEPATSAENSGALQIERAEMFLLDSRLGFYVQASRLARITISYIKATEPTQTLETATVVSADEEGHVALRDGVDLHIDACYQCHPAEDLGVSHPVGVRPGPKTAIPDDLPTLEGGVLTCVTCHSPHGGVRRYFARKETSKDICVSCHEGY